MRAVLKTFVIKKEKTIKKMKSEQDLDVNDEYLSVVRTKSYADFFSKVQFLVNYPSPNIFHRDLSQENILEPDQESIAQVLESEILSRNSSPHLQALLSKYFDISAKASKFCSHLLRSLSQIQSDHRSILEAIDEYSSEQSPFDDISKLCSSLSRLNNPFSNTSMHDFAIILDENSSVLHHLKAKRKRVARKIKKIKFFNKASGACVAAACGLVAAAAIVLAVHSLTALLMGPAVMSIPVKALGKKLARKMRFLKSGNLRRMVEQLDAAAKGAYILNRDFDTMSRLVARLQNEIEHSKAVAGFCLERREDRACLEVLKDEVKQGELGFRKQVEEVEEHVYLCLITINRVRALVFKEICNVY